MKTRWLDLLDGFLHIRNYFKFIMVNNIYLLCLERFE
jgi:hypothetical protein